MNHHLLHLHNQTLIQTDSKVMNSKNVILTITNPNSIFVKVTFTFVGYKQIDLNCYIDTGASLYIASKYVIP